MLIPSHPGAIIRDEVLPAFGLNKKQVAETLKLSRPHLDKLLNGQIALSPEMALKVEAAFGTSAELLLNVQARHDLAQARLRAAEITAGITRQKLAA